MENTSLGITLSNTPFKDNCRIIKVLTKDEGIISLFIKGVNLKKGKLLSLTSPFCLGEFIYKKGNTDLYKFYDGSVIEDNLQLRSSYQNIQTASKLIKAILISQIPLKEIPAIFSLLSTYLKRLVEFKEKETFLISFYLKILLHEGLLHFDSEIVSFTEKEVNQMHEIVLARSFSKLKNLITSEDLCEKVEKFFFYLIS